MSLRSIYHSNAWLTLRAGERGLLDLTSRPVDNIQRDGRASGERIQLRELPAGAHSSAGDQAVVRIDRVVLSLRSNTFLERLEYQFDLAIFLAVSASSAAKALSTARMRSGYKCRITSAPPARSIRIPPAERHRSPL